jgi:hypothetical protein
MTGSVGCVGAVFGFEKVIRTSLGRCDQNRSDRELAVEMWYVWYRELSSSLFVEFYWSR